MLVPQQCTFFEQDRQALDDEVNNFCRDLANRDGVVQVAIKPQGRGYVTTVLWWVDLEDE